MNNGVRVTFVLDQSLIKTVKVHSVEPAYDFMTKFGPFTFYTSFTADKSILWGNFKKV